MASSEPATTHTGTQIPSGNPPSPLNGGMKHRKKHKKSMKKRKSMKKKKRKSMKKRKRKSMKKRK